MAAKKKADACEVVYKNKDGKLDKEATCFLCGMPKKDHKTEEPD